jgi:hypothetical protein
LGQPFRLLREAVDEKITRPFVVDDAARHRVIGGRVTHAVAGDVEILAEKDFNPPLPRGQVFDDDLPEKHVFVKIHGIVAYHQDSKALVVKAHVRDKGVLFVQEFLFPPFADPGKTLPPTHTEAAGVSAHVVFLAHVGIVEIANQIILVETYEEPAIAHRDITWH